MPRLRRTTPSETMRSIGRYYKAPLSQYAKENGITEVLFLYNLSNMVQDLGLPTVK